MSKVAAGQTLVEFTAALMALTIAVTVLVSFLNATWNRFKCAHEVFEETHAILHGLKSSKLSRFRVSEERGSITVSKRCGQAAEQLTLYELERMPW
jgi:hypothetical protein